MQVAQQLRDAGLIWKPGPGDRFAIPDRDLDDAVFVLSEMTIEVYHGREGRLIAFNGTTEWALDDVELDEALWLPHEGQLRELLGGTLRALRREETGWEVEITLLGEDRTFRARTPEEAYARALLYLLSAATS
ncbi:pilus assembly protein CpaE [Actinoplanes sp. NPDC049118]|uniref:pilus assembly protein CpaE n=1 Tax=Actinoplanes sp. NPDC049118 TaxID=3155769 RepID=UPI0033D87574